MLGFGALGEFPLGGGPFGTTALTNPPWFTELSVPVRFRRDPRATVAVNNQIIAFSPLPVVSFSWFEGLAEPVRKRRGLSPGQQQFIAFQPMPSPFVATGWFEALSEPARKRPRSPAALAPFQSFQPAPSPFVATGWFANLSTPVRFKAGLAAARQQFLAAPSRILPRPNITGTMAALETKDTFLAGAMIFNPAASGEIGVVDTTAPKTEIGLSAGNAPGTIASGRLSVTIV